MKHERRSLQQIVDEPWVREPDVAHEQPEQRKSDCRSPSARARRQELRREMFRKDESKW
jgi:hypothetical protein